MKKFKSSLLALSLALTGTLSLGNPLVKAEDAAVVLASSYENIGTKMIFDLENKSGTSSLNFTIHGLD
ncbi:MAG: hypothetical protein LBJ95_01525 [Oscillospiraceae bacterium]|jgi:hypothetical protein|nr:hypothetical protein [Oscillospiraceae bacterium]